MTILLEQRPLSSSKERHYARVSISLKGRKLSEAHKKAVSSGMKKFSSENGPWNKGLTKETHESLKILSEKNIGKTHTEETRKKLSDKLKEVHAAGEVYGDAYKAKQRANLLKMMDNNWKRKNCTPNKMELQLLEFFPDRMKFTGDGSRWVTFKNGKHKNPDFMSFDESKVVELFGGHVHTPEEEKIIQESYEEIGKKCLIIWAIDLLKTPEVVKERIRMFLTVERKQLRFPS